MTDMEAARAGTARFIVGDVFDVLATLEDGSIDLVLTSPPFLALRSYLPAGHPDKAKEIGSEPTPAAFLDTLLRLTAEWRRVLAPHGSICVEMGDTYSGSGGGGGDYDPGGFRDGQPRAGGSAKWNRSAGRKAPGGQPYADTFKGGGPGGAGWPLPKSLCGIPHLYHLSLAYGRNLLTGEPSPAGSWRVRNVVAWCRPNPTVGALGDKVRPATSYLTMACISRTRYFDLDAIRNEAKWHPTQQWTDPQGTTDVPGQPRRKVDRSLENPAGPPPLDHWWFEDEFDQTAWLVTTQPYKGAHYATWPAALLERPIRAMCPARVCTTCGGPSRRLTETDTIDRIQGNNVKGFDKHSNRFAERTTTTTTTTTGWTDCGHNTWRNGLVLDPFAGSGTTLAAATGHGRDAIGIDIDSRNADLARERVGMFLEVEHAEAVAVRTPDERRLL